MKDVRSLMVFYILHKLLISDHIAIYNRYYLLSLYQTKVKTKVNLDTLTQDKNGKKYL